MRFHHAIICLCLSLLPAAALARVTENLDAGWRFLQTDAPGADAKNFDDDAWRKLELPHDWSIAGPFAATNKTGGAGGFLPGGVGWYRQHFTLPKEESGQCVTVEFDGVMQNSDVWINGAHLGHRPNGYVSFRYPLTGHLNFGGDNVIAVRADTSAQPASRWYSGAGIYRHVRLVVTELVHFDPAGVFISTPQISATQALVQVQAAVTNESDAAREISVTATIHGPPHSAPDGSYACSGESPAVSIPPGQSATVTFTVKLPWAPRLWSLEHPDLHTAGVRLRAAGQTLDEQTIPFGIRDAHFEADTGFWLNGKNFKLKGVCLHADGGAFGAAVPLSIWEARLKTLKALGVNSLRTAHNPPAPEFLDLCDRLGFLVMDEFFDCWTVAKNPYDYHLFFDEWSKTDERDSIRRDRNHPSIILYSVGNEIHDTPQAEKAKRILSGLVQVAHETDPTRPVTQALFRPNVSHDYDDGLADLLDVIGQNYRENEILAAHEQNPARKILGTENTHDRRQWLAMRDHAPYAGQFLWTGIDYLGEARKWPAIGHGSGLLDRTGAIRPLARERASWWSEAPMVSVNRRVATEDLMPADPGYGGEERHTQVVFADWTPGRLTPHTENVEVYSNCKTVELFLNGASLGQKAINADASPRNWPVPFAPGSLKAVARDAAGIVVATDELRTAGQPSKIILTSERKALAPGFEEVAIVRATIVDAAGVPVPRADDLISFQIAGPGVVAAVDNGSNTSHELFQADACRAFQGGCVAFVKATAASGDIVLKATAPGLKDGSIIIQASHALSRWFRAMPPCSSNLNSEVTMENLPAPSAKLQSSSTRHVRIPLRQPLAAWSLLFLGSLALGVWNLPLQAADFAFGADLSFLRQAEQHGTVFRDGTNALPGLQVFKNHGYNWIRLRLFVEPVSNGLPNDLAYTLAVAQDAKKLGYKFLLDFHYANSWADPGKQPTPGAWLNQTHPQRVKTVFAYTRDTLTAFRDAGLLPDMVQIGNEVTAGMLWPDGKLPAHWDNFTDYLRAGIQGVDAGRGTNPAPRIMIHTDTGGSRAKTKWFFDNLNRHHIAYDVIGLSYYPRWQGTLMDLRENLAFAANTCGKDIMIVETGYNWRPSRDFKDRGAPFPETPGGQRDFLDEVTRLALQTPGQRCTGIFWWEPATGQRGARGFFDETGNSLPVLAVFDKYALPLPRTGRH